MYLHFFEGLLTSFFFVSLIAYNSCSVFILLFSKFKRFLDYLKFSISPLLLYLVKQSETLERSTIINVDGEVHRLHNALVHQPITYLLLYTIPKLIRYFFHAPPPRRWA